MNLRVPGPIYQILPSFLLYSPVTPVISRNPTPVILTVNPNLDQLVVSPSSDVNNTGYDIGPPLTCLLSLSPTLIRGLVDLSHNLTPGPAALITREPGRVLHGIFRYIWHLGIDNPNPFTPVHYLHVLLLSLCSQLGLLRKSRWVTGIGLKDEVYHDHSKYTIELYF